MNLFKKEGIQQGQQKHLVEQVSKKLKKCKTAAEIAEDLEEDINEITRICQVAEKYAPDYDTEAIYNELMKEKGFD